MPIYAYRCDACGHELEAMQKFSDAALTDCPSCGKTTLKRQLTAAGFQLKGGGWYATDSKGGGAKAEKSESDSSSSGTKKHGCGGGTCGCAH